MKQGVKYLLLLLLPLFAFADFVKWMGSYDSAHQKALKAQKPLLVLVVKKNSPATSKLIHDIFMDHSYVEKINSHTVPVIVTYEGKLSYPIEMYYTTHFPTLFFADSSRELFMHTPLYGKELQPDNLQRIMTELFK